MNWLSLIVGVARGSYKKSWLQRLKKEFNINFIALQESHIEDVDSIYIIGFWRKQ